MASELQFAARCLTGRCRIKRHARSVRSKTGDHRRAIGGRRVTEEYGMVTPRKTVKEPVGGGLVGSRRSTLSVRFVPGRHAKLHKSIWRKCRQQ
jgi:hypothetical protein